MRARAGGRALPQRGQREGHEASCDAHRCAGTVTDLRSSITPSLRPNRRHPQRACMQYVHAIRVNEQACRAITPYEFVVDRRGKLGSTSTPRSLEAQTITTTQVKSISLGFVVLKTSCILGSAAIRLSPNTLSSTLRTIRACVNTRA